MLYFDDKYNVCAFSKKDLETFFRNFDILPWANRMLKQAVRASFQLKKVSDPEFNKNSVTYHGITNDFKIEDVTITVHQDKHGIGTTFIIMYKHKSPEIIEINDNSDTVTRYTFNL